MHRHRWDTRISGCIHCHQCHLPTGQIHTHLPYATKHRSKGLFMYILLLSPLVNTGIHKSPSHISSWSMALKSLLRMKKVKFTCQEQGAKQRQYWGYSNFRRAGKPENLQDKKTATKRNRIFFSVNNKGRVRTRTRGLTLPANLTTVPRSTAAQYDPAVPGEPFVPF